MSQRKLEKIYNSLLERAKFHDDEDLNILVDELRKLIEEEEAKKVVKGWEAGTGGIKFPNDTVMEIQVHRNKNHPGIMIHRNYKNKILSPGWQISLEAGLRIVNVNYKTKTQAIKTFSECAGNIDWNRPLEVLSGDREIMEAIVLIRGKGKVGNNG
jgi:hypothetical protein